MELLNFKLRPARKNPTEKATTVSREISVETFATFEDAKKAKKKWLQKAVDPKHKGFCTPVTKKTCTPKRKAFAMTMKKHHGFHKKSDK